MHQTPPTRRSPRRAACWFAAFCCLTPALLLGQPQQQPPPAPAPPLAGPIVEADAELWAGRTTSWKARGVVYLLLEQRARIAVGAYRFQAERALVRIETDKRPGMTVRRIAAVLDRAVAPRDVGAVSAEADRLLVTVATRGQVELETDLLVREDASAGDFAQEAIARMQRYDRSLAHGVLPVPPDALTSPEADARLAEIRRRASEPREPVELRPAQPAVVQEPPPPPAQPEPRVVETQRILPRRGTIAFRADRPIVRRVGSDEWAVVLIGGVRVLYQSHEGDQSMALRAENAVIFVSGDDPNEALGAADAGNVRGIYLEDNVIATDGTYTIRAPRVYYDLPLNRALVLNAVFFTWDERRQIPIYVRADEVRQTSRDTWEASNARFTTSEFAEPHFAIAADSLTIEQDQAPDGSPRFRMAAEDVTARAGPVPVFWWPAVAGETRDVPLRSVSAGYSNDEGPIVRTRWDVFALLGRQKPEGVDLSADIDWLGDHGAGLGLELDYDTPGMWGHAQGYIVPHDNADDEIANRRDIEHDGDVRGFAHWQHRHLLEDNWELSIETAYVSDPTFLEEYFRSMAETEKPLETSIYLKKQEEDWAFTFLAKDDLYDFVAQTPSLQTPGYSVEKLPEIGYYRVGTSLWEDRLTYYTENRLGRVRIDIGEDSPADRGFTDAQSLINFGFAPASLDFDRVADAAGIPSGSRLRFDSRHELQAPLKLGPVDAVPFVAGRVTLYDEDFEEFSDEDENARLMGTVGVRLHTQFTRTDDTAVIPMLDVHRLRHIIEPSADLSLTGSTADPEAFPVYDPQVEGVTEGAAFRLGLRNTWQTQRGGPGRWRSVDWIILDTDFILRSDDADTETPLPRFFGYRPEYARGGDHFYTNLLWQVSDNVAFTGDLTYGFEDDEIAQWHAGLSLHHTDRLTTFIDYGEITPLDSRLLSWGLTYQLTRKYTVSAVHRIDIDEEETRSLDLMLVRHLPRWRLAFVASFDDIDDEQTFGIVLIPDGIHRGDLPTTAADALGRR